MLAPWWAGLPSETLERLRARYPELSLDEIAIATMRLPGWELEFERLDAEVLPAGPARLEPVILYEDEEREQLHVVDGEVVFSYAESEPAESHFEPERSWVPSWSEAAFRELVVAAALADHGLPNVGAEKDDLVGGGPYSKVEYEAAGKLHRAGKMTVSGIVIRADLRRKRAYRLYRQFDHGAVIFDEAGLRPGPGYQWEPAARETDPPGHRLIRR